MSQNQTLHTFNALSPFVAVEMQFPLEIWMKIVSLLRISLSEERPSDIRNKRHALLNLALTHSMLTEIALDELWRSMEFLQPVGDLAFHCHRGTFYVILTINVDMILG